MYFALTVEGATLGASRSFLLTEPSISFGFFDARTDVSRLYCIA